MPLVSMILGFKDPYVDPYIYIYIYIVTVHEYIHKKRGIKKYNYSIQYVVNIFSFTSFIINIFT